MGSVIVQVEGTGQVWDLEAGQQVVFGRGAGVDIVLPVQAVSRAAGVIRAVRDHWTLSNLSRRATYVVENPEGGGEFVKVAPGRAEAPIPFEFGRICLPGVKDGPVLLVFAPEHSYSDLPADGGAGSTVIAYSLDTTANYFPVLVALCEPRLRDPASVLIPTTAQIADRIGLTTTAVAWHINYLATTKLRVKRPAEEQDGRQGKADWQRAALVSLALRFDLVRLEHLESLAPDQGR
ncbi:MAG: serine/threonine protein kinase [Thermoactinospora sp.]|nr:serine/threonine protein kinase [Thermoactinospora sp.]